MRIIDKVFGKRNEYITLPVALVLMLGTTLIGNYFQVYVHGIEVFQKIIIGTVFLLIINALVRFILRPVFPVLYRYLDEDNKETKGWDVLPTNQRIFLSFGLFALYFWGLIQLVSSL